MLASCEGRPFPARDDSGFGIEDAGDGDGDSGTESGDGDGDGDGSTTTTGPSECFSVVDDLSIDDTTHPDSVACVERVLGDLTIGPTTQLLDLGMLAKLERVDGTLFVHGNLALTSLAGLAALESVNRLHVRRNHNLDSLAGLDGLVAVNHITISSNEGLTSIAGLPDGLAPKLVEIDKNDLLPSLDGLPIFVPPVGGHGLRVELARNPTLVDLAGLSDCCAELPVSLALDSNHSLTDLDGLEVFVRLEALELHDNLGLVDLDGLDSLVEIGELIIDYDRCMPNASPSLLDLGGAEQLDTIGTLELEWIASLVGLDGLDGVETIDKLFIRNNEMLPWSDMVELRAQTNPPVHLLCGGVDAEQDCPSEAPCPMF